MLTLSEKRRQDIRQAVAAGHSSERIAETVFSSLFDFDKDIGLDYDDQVNYALRIGVLIGTAQSWAAGDKAEYIISNFEKNILNGLE